MRPRNQYTRIRLETPLNRNAMGFECVELTAFAPLRGDRADPGDHCFCSLRLSAPTSEAGTLGVSMTLPQVTALRGQLQMIESVLLQNADALARQSGPEEASDAGES